MGLVTQDPQDPINPAPFRIDQSQLRLRVQKSHMLFPCEPLLGSYYGGRSLMDRRTIDPRAIFP